MNPPSSARSVKGAGKTTTKAGAGVAAGSSVVRGLIRSSSAQPVAGSSPRRNRHCCSNPSTSSTVVRTSEPWQR